MTNLKPHFKMKQVFEQFISHKDLYFLSISIGAISSFIANIFLKVQESQLFGLSLSLWIIAFFVNIIDIHTGIKADTARKKKVGEKFKFESNKGWRAFEKIFIFSLIIFFIYSIEKESFRLNYPEFTWKTLMTIKFIAMIYVILIEIQSIGENEEVRFGKKSKIFKLLDTIIEIVNDGIISKIKNLIK